MNALGVLLADATRRRYARAKEERPYRRDAFKLPGPVDPEREVVDGEDPAASPDLQDSFEWGEP